MKKWILKAIIQKVITYFPFSFQINYFFQKYITKNVFLSDDFFNIMCDHFIELTEYCSLNGAEFKNIKVIELGTGWHPIIPVLLFITGVEEIVTLDLRSHVRKENLKLLLEKVVGNYEANRFSQFPIKIQKDRVEIVKDILNNFEKLSISEILSRCSIQQKLQDANHLDFNDNSFDLCYSVNVLEHVDIDSIRGISAEFFRIGKSNSYHYHAIGVYDHFVHIDKSISKFNYLKYSDSIWKAIDNKIQPQNRRRISYFRNTFNSIGYTILNEILWDAEPNELNKIDIHPDFNNLADIDIPYGTFILKK